MTVRYTITGLVQGIGFRPNVKRAADSAGIRGTVKNLGGIVEILAEGDEARQTEFISLVKAAPFSRIESITAEETEGSFADFTIAVSGAEGAVSVISADIAVCPDCVEELFDSNNRRYRHPFISCTKCGPRYSVIEKLPYDRENITMADFEMCGECAEEYGNISDMRCHAQTIACKSCGPVLSYTVAGDPIEETVRTIMSGGVAAVKNIGGYHFVCSALDNAAAVKVRQIKNRETKPFAVMFGNTADAAGYAYIDALERELLESPARPIVLLKKRKELPPAVCGESDYIGAMLPADPVQYMLTERCGALVMTSGNVSGEPVIIDDARMAELRAEKDFEILSHNRRILTPLDDSVCRVICGKKQILRRARGYTPEPIYIGGDREVFAAGGDMKAAFCCTRGGSAYMSQYFGDLENAAVFDVWRANIDRMKRIMSFMPDDFIADTHPMYLSASYMPQKQTVQHHFAHMASVMAEHCLTGRVLGFIFDGTGYGEDGCVWGGEAVIWDNGFKRAAHLSYTELAGGDESAKNAELLLDCYLISADCDPVSSDGELIKAAIKNHVNTVKSSSMGRLFDAVSAMLGICGKNSYEGECAVKLESAASKAGKAYPLELRYDGEWDVRQLIRDMAGAVCEGADKAEISLGFHAAVARAVGRFAAESGIKTIVLSGGVFANRILTELCFKELKGYDVYINEQVPPNDGGIALGQAWTAMNEFSGKRRTK